MKNFQIIANNSGGVCVIKEIMKRFQENKKFGNEINLFISCVNKNLDFIIQNPFGNYVIQNMIEVFFILNIFFNLILIYRCFSLIMKFL